MEQNPTETIAIIGAGPSGLFMLKNLLQHSKPNRIISIFEKKQTLGAGMPYSEEGANVEHITNVSANEIPELVTSVAEWLEGVPADVLDFYNINADYFNEYKVLPRLLFGSYLEAQFHLLLLSAERSGVEINLYLNSKIKDIKEAPATENVQIFLENGDHFEFDRLVVCTGHSWPKKLEGKIEGYFDSPYPPAKLKFKANHPVAIKGSSLTAIDAIRTLSRFNGTYSQDKDGKFSYKKNADSPDFKIVMHSRSGLLPAVRFHLEDSHLGTTSLLSEKEIQAHIKSNGGFLSLDYIFDQNFKKILLERDPDLYAKIASMKVEEFTETMLKYREGVDAFELLKQEYENAAKSIDRKESIYWKELLAILSFALNYPAKYLSAEDMIRLQKSLMPLISVIIAFVPQSSAAELLALHQAGVLEIIAVGEDSEVIENEEGGVYYKYSDENGAHSDYYKTFVNCVGQPHFSIESFPFEGLRDGIVSAAFLEFKSEQKGKDAEKENKNVFKSDDKFLLKVPGIRINDNFQVIGEDGKTNDSIFVMAVPYIGGYNPDYSGLDFCEEASGRIANTLQ